MPNTPWSYSCALLLGGLTIKIIFAIIIIEILMIQRDSIITYQSQRTSQDLTNNLITQEIEVQQAKTFQIVYQQQVKERLTSLDILRGLTMVGMILVDNSPSPPWYLDHAQWNGVTPADFIFPSFLFIMGMAIPMALTKNKPFGWRSIIRIVALFGIGVLLNLTARKYTFNHFRIMGILQRISLCYGALSIVHVLTNYGQKRSRFIGFLVALFFTALYTAFMFTFSNSDCPERMVFTKQCNFGAFLDQSIFGQMHMIFPNDPEGLFTTLSAFLNGFAGYHFCLVMKDNKGKTARIILMWVLISLVLGAISYPLTFAMPFNKKIWSISFVFLTSAVSGLSLAFITFAVDFLGNIYKKYGKVINTVLTPFVWLGRNPLAVFVLMDLVAIFMIKYIFIDGKSLWAQFFYYGFHKWISNKQIASNLFAVFWVVIWTIVSGTLYVFKIFIKL